MVSMLSLGSRMCRKKRKRSKFVRTIRLFVGLAMGVIMVTDAIEGIFSLIKRDQSGDDNSGSSTS